MSSLVSAARRSSFFLLVLALALGGCSTRSPGAPVPPPPDSGFPDLGAEVDLGSVEDATVTPRDMQFDPDMACTSASAEAILEPLPADIIWVVDNSSSLDEEIDNITDGINAFAAFIDGSGIDYHVVMLSRRGVGSVRSRINGSTVYQICVPPPLAGDDACGNGPRFFHSDVEIASTQPLEHVLGTLGQTTGFREGDARGGEPWRDFLRPEASKMFVVVTDDNARLSKALFEHFRGPAPAVEWRNPAPASSVSTFLPPGLLEPEWGGLFDDYKMSGIYGYECPSANSGPTYTEIITATGGVRADICAPPSTWGTFFESIATEVVRATRISCDLAIPPPPAGLMFSPARVNVEVRATSSATALRKTTGGLAGCASLPNGWYFDDDKAPTRVLLCPEACDLAQGEAGTGDTSVQIQFGCETIFG